MKLLVSLFLFISLFFSSGVAQNPNQYFVRFADKNISGALFSTSSASDVGELSSLLSKNESSVQKRKINSPVVERLHRTFVLTTQINYTEEDLLTLLSSSYSIELIERIPDSQIFLTPNDPDLGGGNQNYLQHIKATAAWDETTGSKDVIIAVLDTGTDYTHPDMVDNLWNNPEEANGPSSENGYSGDLHGWDFVDKDASPLPNNNTHGSHVGGILGATTNNGIGIASLAFNTTYMPIRVGASSIPFGYLGIIYAAENGADVINCSWGSPVRSQIAHDIVKYATELGALLVAAAGNDNRNQAFYPAGFPEVIAVSSSENTFLKSGFSNFGTFVTLSAPGAEIFSTLPSTQYGFSSGTSMAAPVVSALAGLVKSKNPTWDANQIRANLVATSRPHALSGTEYDYLLGNGQIDAEAAVTSPAQPLFQIVDYSAVNPLGGSTQDNLVILNASIQNLGISTSGTLTLEPLFEIPASISNNTFVIESTEHNGLWELNDVTVNILPNATIDQEILLKATFSYENSQIETFEIISFKVNASSATLNANTIELSVNARGRIGFLDYPNTTSGSGFIIRTNSTTAGVSNVPLLTSAGLLINDVNSSERVSDNLIGASSSVLENDFSIRTSTRLNTLVQGGLSADIEFADINAGTESYELIIKKSVYAFSELELENAIIMEYTLENGTRNTDYAGIRIGLFLDFDLPPDNRNNDFVYYDEENDIIIQQSGSGDSTLYIGATVASGIGTPWLINNSLSNPTASNFKTTDGFTNTEKGLSLYGGVFHKQQGPGNVAFVISPTSFRLPVDIPQTKYFVLLYANTLDDLLSTVERAKFRVQEIISHTEKPDIEIPSGFDLGLAYPNPFNSRTVLPIQVSQTGAFSIYVTDVLGRTVIDFGNMIIPAGNFQLPIDAKDLSTGIYTVVVRNKEIVKSQRFTLLR